jgi:uncharacterized membrane protein (DUF4010 family)
MLVLFFSGLSFAGYVARRIAGASHGYLAAGLLGGLISSTNVTFTFARTSRAEPTLEDALAFGAIGANGMLFPRVLLATAILNPVVAAPLGAYLAAPALVALVALTIGIRKAGPAGAPAPPPRNPLQLTAALQMAVLFQAVLMAVHVARERWGASGVLTSAVVLGLTDVDALTVSMTKAAESLSAATAATAIGVGILSNTAIKIALALVLGSRRFAIVTAGVLTVMLAALALALVVPRL